jgi:hypothetical protein
VSTDARLAAPPTVPVYDPPKTYHSSDGASDQTREALQILNAIFRDKRVVRANQNCSGTLLSSPAAGDLHPISRKNNFRVDLGQYLVRLTDYRPRYSRTRVFCNTSGEIGELSDTFMLAPIQDTNSKLSLSLICSFTANPTTLQFRFRYLRLRESMETNGPETTCRSPLLTLH